jgi:hypothetical protein
LGFADHRSLDIPLAEDISTNFAAFLPILEIFLLKSRKLGKNNSAGGLTVG